MPSERQRQLEMATSFANSHRIMEYSVNEVSSKSDGNASPTRKIVSFLESCCTGVWSPFKWVNWHCSSARSTVHGEEGGQLLLGEPLENRMNQSPFGKRSGNAAAVGKMCSWCSRDSQALMPGREVFEFRVGCLRRAWRAPIAKPRYTLRCR